MVQLGPQFEEIMESPYGLVIYMQVFQIYIYTYCDGIDKIEK